MSDLISRQMAIDAINSMFAPTPTQMDIKEDCLEIIENLPSAQPEIIYCKDCKWHKKEIGWNCIEYMVCDKSVINKPIRNDDDFCSRAERRTGER